MAARAAYVMLGILSYTSGRIIELFQLLLSFCLFSLMPDQVLSLLGSALYKRLPLSWVVSRRRKTFHRYVRWENGTTVTSFRCHNVHVWTKHDDVIKWKQFPRNWPFVRGIHRWPVNSPHKGQWRGALMVFFDDAWTHDWANNRDTGDLRRHHTHYDVTLKKSVSDVQSMLDARDHFLGLLLFWGHNRFFATREIKVFLVWKCEIGRKLVWKLLNILNPRKFMKNCPSIVETWIWYSLFTKR